MSHSAVLPVEEALEKLMLPYEFDLSILETIETKNLPGHIERVGKVVYERTSIHDGRTH
ncbi:hypothetical protein [uncultured Endozoicomonas sp.]|uniref:hypothetical protein n=1 Tax=uncultured Endozoicomonas sp. TaxID=432652 RepID=UPI0026214ED2|nr:hypothetical protein [uncultured Endozoicomonas sp.]